MVVATTAHRRQVAGQKARSFGSIIVNTGRKCARVAEGRATVRDRTDNHWGGIVLSDGVHRQGSMDLAARPSYSHHSLRSRCEQDGKTYPVDGDKIQGQKHPRAPCPDANGYAAEPSPSGLRLSSGDLPSLGDAPDNCAPLGGRYHRGKVTCSNSRGNAPESPATPSAETGSNRHPSSTSDSPRDHRVAAADHFSRFTVDFRCSSHGVSSTLSPKVLPHSAH